MEYKYVLNLIYVIFLNIVVETTHKINIFRVKRQAHSLYMYMMYLQKNEQAQRFASLARPRSARDAQEYFKRFTAAHFGAAQLTWMSPSLFLFSIQLFIAHMLLFKFLLGMKPHLVIVLKYCLTLSLKYLELLKLIKEIVFLCICFFRIIS